MLVNGLFCGSTTHRFSSCPKKDNVDNKTLFWQELWELSLNQGKDERP